MKLTVITERTDTEWPIDHPLREVTSVIADADLPRAEFLICSESGEARLSPIGDDHDVEGRCRCGRDHHLPRLCAAASHPDLPDLLGRDRPRRRITMKLKTMSIDQLIALRNRVETVPESQSRGRTVSDRRPAANDRFSRTPRRVARSRRNIETNRPARPGPVVAEHRDGWPRNWGPASPWSNSESRPPKMRPGRCCKPERKASR